MNGWKELKIDNLPIDILTGGYEFEMFEKRVATYTKCYWEPIEMIKHIGQKPSQILYSFAYREQRLKAPTHEEIMTKWWKDPNDPSAGWAKVHRFYCTEYHIWNITATKGFFLNIKSADIPPETE